MKRVISAYLLFYKAEQKIRKDFNRICLDNGIDLTFDQWLVLGTIERLPNTTQTVIVKTTAKDKASVHRIVKKLMERGFVQTQPTDHIQPSRSLLLTPAGKNIIDQIEPLLHSLSQSLKDLFFERELNLLENLLKRFHQE